MSSFNFIDLLPFEIDSVWIHPLGLITAQNLMTLFLVGFTPARSLIRPILFPVVIGCAWITIFNSNKIVAGLSWTFVLQYLDLCLLSKWSFETGGPEIGGAKSRPSGDEKKGPRNPSLESEIDSSFAERWRFGWDSTFGYRHIGTPQESRNTPHFDERDPEYVPTRKAFYAKQIFIIVRGYLLVDLVNSLSQNRTWKDVEIFSRLGDVTKDEMCYRFFRVAVFWVTVQSLWKGLYSLISLIAVGSGLSEPQFWRPLFASPLEAYSIRRFWGNSWHQILRRVLGNPASFICHDFLGIKHEFVARYVKLYLTFLISGLLHAAMDFAGGIPFDNQGSVRFLVTQAIGITAEDAARSLYRRVRGNRDIRRQTPLWARMIGSLWTISFLVWTTPSWFYPETNRREMSPIEFSLVGLARSYFE